MSFKENQDMHSFIKPEPQEGKLPSAPLSISSNTNSASSSMPIIKPEPSLDSFLDRAYPVVPSGRNDASASGQDARMLPAPSKTFTIYQSVADISYSSEEALKEGRQMVQSIKTYMQKLNLGSKRRQEVWGHELASLEAQTSPKTLIAVCGATGAGKSSILNALLDDNIVPTSGMRACTAVVTEIAHHAKSTIDADVSFLSVSEWKEELSVLQHDLIEEDGSLKRTTDLKSDAGVAWQKVHAVYPTLSQEKLVQMTPDQIVAHDQRIANVLGNTKNISARNSQAFGEKIAKYIDSKDQSRGKKDKKNKSKEKDERSLMDKVREAAGVSKKKKDSKELNEPAFWPLIRQVNVRCPAKCLSSGCVLVDLPGVADANAARNTIAKDYMKKAQCIWILAPITRAVDDKTARDLLGDAFKMQLMMDGNYDDHAITFIASKTDDISCSEVINALHLRDDPELEVIEKELERINEETSEWKSKKSASDKLVKGIDKELKTIRAIFKEHEEHLEALRNGEEFTPRLTAATATKPKKNNIKKRKNRRSGKKGSPKRRRSSADSDLEVDDESEEVSDESDEDENSDSDSSSSDSDSDEDSNSDSGSDSESSKRSSKSDDEDDSDAEVEELVEAVTEESVQAKLEQAKADIKAARGRLTDSRKEKKEALDRLASLKKSLMKAQKIKNAWCSVKRSEFSRDVLKEDFRTGLKDLDDEVAEGRDPENFDPSVKLRDYDAINLPVFTCSSRDYVRLTNQIKGDGEPSCFSDKASTGIPDLQEWCHSLTIASRTRAVKMFYDQLKTFATSINIFVTGIGGVTTEDRQALQAKWESNYDDDDEDDYGFDSGDAELDYEDPFSAFLGTQQAGHNLIALHGRKNPPKVDEAGNVIGVTPRLKTEFSKIVDKCVEDLNELFKDGLEDKCRVGASLAADGAVDLSDAFAASMHWSTYRATLRRHGEWRRDLNTELLAPFTKNIAASWSKLFETDLLGQLETTVQASVRSLLDDMENSAAIGLKDRVKVQGDFCLTEAEVALKQTVAVVRETVNTEQKEVSRCLAPHVQSNLTDGYDLAMEETGRGSVQRQKMVFHHFIEARKDDVFDEGADVLLERLSTMCTSVGKALNVAFKELAKKIEVNLAVLWEETQDNHEHAEGRREIVDAIHEILGQVQLWHNAASEKAKSASAVAQALEDVDTEMD